MPPKGLREIIMYNKKSVLTVWVLATVVLVLLDQFSKSLAVKYLKEKPSISLIDKVLELFYLENHGAAFGILQNGQIFFVIITAVILIAIFYVLYRMPAVKAYSLLFVLLSLLVAGAVGNLIDRIRLGYVVDFIYVSFIDFPVFNVADMYVTISTALIIISALFIYRDDEFYFLRFSRKESADKKLAELLKMTGDNNKTEASPSDKTEDEVETYEKPVSEESSDKTENDISIKAVISPEKKA